MKVIKYSDPRVVVRPTRAGDYGFCSIGGIEHSFDYAMELCKEIEQQIARHVDNTGSRYIEIEYDENPVCEHCGADWSEESNEYNGGCCAKDEENLTEIFPGTTEALNNL